MTTAEGLRTIGAALGAALWLTLPASGFAEETLALWDLRKVAVAAEASSCEEGLAAALAFDGDPGTRWSSQRLDNQWISVDLGARREISAIRLLWEAAYAADYRLEVSDDGRDWREVQRQRDGRGGKETFSFTGLAARYVRLYGLRRGTGWGFSLWEFVVEGPLAGAEPEYGGLVRPPTHVTVFDRDWEHLSRAFAEQCARDPRTSASLSDDELLDLIERRAFDFFWYEVHPETFFVVDSTTWKARTSCAGIGLQLGAYIAGHARRYRPPEEIYERVERLLDHCWDDPEDSEDLHLEHHEGWPYHWLDIETGRWRGEEHVCTHDAILYLCGVIAAKHYFAGTQAGDIAERILAGVRWDWIIHGGRNRRFVSNCFAPTYDPPCGGEVRFYDGMKFDYLLPLGAATNAIAPAYWHNYALDFPWDAYEGRFWRIERPAPWCHQWDQLWFDFQYMKDDYADYFQNSVEAALANRQWCLDHGSYHEDLWGVGPSHGPPRFAGVFYGSYGAPPDDLPFQRGTDNDGTVSPSASLGSLVFAPREVIRVARFLYDRYRDRFWRRYGFPDALNPQQDWYDREYIAIDVGPILLAIENYRSRLFYELLAKEDQVWRGLRRAGFVGIVDNFDESEHSPPYATWYAAGDAAAIQFARSGDYVREGQHSLRVTFDASGREPAGYLAARPGRKDFSPYAYLTFWIRRDPGVSVAVVTARGQTVPLSPAAERAEGLGWKRVYLEIPDAARGEEVAEVRFTVPLEGRGAFWLDGVLLSHEIPPGEPPWVIEDFGRHRAEWSCEPAGSFRYVTGRGEAGEQGMSVAHVPPQAADRGVRLVARAPFTDWSRGHSLAFRVRGDALLGVRLTDAEGRSFPVGTQEVRGEDGWQSLLFNLQANLNPANCWEPRYDKRQIAELSLVVRPRPPRTAGQLYLAFIALTD